MPKLTYIAEPGIINLSYSKSKVLHECPRKFQLRENFRTGEHFVNIHTAFGHAYAAAIQCWFTTKDYELCLLSAMAHWDLPQLMGCEPPRNSRKCFEEVLIAFDIFIESIYPLYFEGKWEIAQLDSHPAVELLYYLAIGDKFAHQGHIDLILQSVETGALCVAEIKTSERAVHPSQWSNSAQTLTYTVLCDELAKQYGLHNEYQVIYIIYNPKQEEGLGHTVYHFQKPASLKVEAINTILMECNQIATYEDAGFYPKNGDSCYSFFRACELYGLCDMAGDGKLVQPQNSQYAIVPLEAADLYVRIEDLAALSPEYGSSNQPTLIPAECI